MQRVLEKLWYQYLEESEPSQSLDEKIALNMIAEADKKLRNGLNDEQIKLLDEYVELWGDMCNIQRKESFIKGVRFATKYLLEATE
ncbi:MAG: hypothetical protein IKT37_00765 [Clostridia bacterium]|nr:hypothetical protein [Clostridia bacterium]